MPEASLQLNMPQPKVPPVSAVTVAAISSARSIRSPATFWSASRRADGGVALHSGNAADAASAAARASLRVAAAATAAVSPVNGS
jgi:transposase